MDIVRFGYGFKKLQKNHPRLLTEALRRSPENLARAASEWKAFTDEIYINRDIAVPDYPMYVEIKEALGLYGRSKFERVFRRLKRRAQRRLNGVFYGVLSIFGLG